MAERNFSNDDGEVLANHSMQLCKAIREMLVGNIPKLVEKANDLGSYKMLVDIETRVRGVEDYVRHRRKSGASDLPTSEE